ncbi:hypothetical protein DPMN_036519 [Dreissena polymorpha]|uniref:Uncharacterized protein n=1 Tax=Dreissena polymorpha TaxID=45954 RepID=A0A9D4RNW9_DREPO|nr:hypothetical protein DPMN_036519 [Dreissena polymorpha]
MTITANDNGNPARTSFVEAFITVIRDQFPPVFINLPYGVTLSEYTSVGSFVFDTNATDSDLVVRIDMSKHKGICLLLNLSLFLVLHFYVPHHYSGGHIVFALSVGLLVCLLQL